MGGDQDGHDDSHDSGGDDCDDADMMVVMLTAITMTVVNRVMTTGATPVCTLLSLTYPDIALMPATSLATLFLADKYCYWLWFRLQDAKAAKCCS